MSAAASRRAAILSHHPSIAALSKAISVKQETVVIGIETGFTASPKLAAEFRRLGVPIGQAKVGRQWRHYRFAGGER